jgi:hypothetical protein
MTMGRALRFGGLACMFVVVSTCAATHASAAGTAVSQTTTVKTATWVRGWVRLSALTPVRGARVRLETANGKPIAGSVPVVTNAQGGFVMPVSSVPKRFVVVARGGRAAGKPTPTTLRELALKFRPDHDLIEANLLTTILAQRQAVQPYEPFAASVARVHRLFSIPAGHTIEHDASASAEYFDGLRFIAFARAHGGVASYLAQIQHQLENRHSTRLDFGGKRPRLPGGLRQVASATRTADASTYILTQLANGVVSNVGARLFGAVLSQLGTGDAPTVTAAQIQALSDQLKTIMGQLSTINTDMSSLKNLITQANYNNLTGQLNDETSEIDGIMTSIQSIVDNPGPAAWAANEKVAGIELKAINNDLYPKPGLLNSYLGTGSGGAVATPLLTVAQQYFFANLEATHPLVSGGMLSEPAQQVYEFYAMHEAELANLLVEADTANDFTSQRLTSSDITPAQSYVANWAPQVVGPIPAFQFADLRTGRLWSVATALLNWDPNCPGEFTSGFASASQVGMHAPEPDSPIVCSFPIAGFGLPSIGDLTALTAGWNAPIVAAPATAQGSPAGAVVKNGPVAAGGIAPDVGSWLVANVGTYAAGTAASTIPPAGNYTAGPFGLSGSAGTPYTFWTNSCAFDNTIYNAAVEPGYVYQVGDLTSCQLLDLATGTVTTECVADEETYNGGITGGCDLVLSSYLGDQDSGRYNGPIAQYYCGLFCGPLAGWTTATLTTGLGSHFDYYHSNLAIGWTTSPAGEYWIPD